MINNDLTIIEEFKIGDQEPSDEYGGFSDEESEPKPVKKSEKPKVPVKPIKDFEKVKKPQKKIIKKQTRPAKNDLNKDLFDVRKPAEFTIDDTGADQQYFSSDDDIDEEIIEKAKKPAPKITKQIQKQIDDVKVDDYDVKEEINIKNNDKEGDHKIHEFKIYDQVDSGEFNDDMSMEGSEKSSGRLKELADKKKKDHGKPPVKKGKHLFQRVRSYC